MPTQSEIDAYAYKRNGTPETHARAARARQWPINRMYERGLINAEERAGAEEICLIREKIGSQVSVNCASLETRIDYSASARGVLFESLQAIRLEATYNRWRQSLPIPRGLVLDLVSSSVPHARTAQLYNTSPNTARRRLLTALRSWLEFREEVYRQIGADDVIAIHKRLGEGILIARCR